MNTSSTTVKRRWKIPESGTSASEACARGLQNIMTFDQVRRATPPTPSCFTRESWVAYLYMVEQNSKSPSRPFKNGVYRPEFSYCADCTLNHSVFMSRKGLCNPSELRVILIKEVCSHE